MRVVEYLLGWKFEDGALVQCAVLAGRPRCTAHASTGARREAARVSLEFSALGLLPVSISRLKETQREAQRD